MSSVQLLETRGNSARWGRDDHFASVSIYKILKPSIVPVSTSKPRFSLLEAPGVSVQRPKPHVFAVAGALSCIPGISACWAQGQPGRRAGVQPPQLSRGAAGCLPGQWSPPALRRYHFSIKV